VKAIRVEKFGDPEVMQLADVPAPKPGNGQCLIRLHAIGVNPVDTYLRAGTYSHIPTSLPFTPGIDGSGVIEETQTPGFRAGDRVYFSGSVSGAYAELALCEASRVFHLPENASYNEGAAIGVPCATAYRGLFQRARALPGETVLVHGATGGVGSAAVQLARAAGLTVFGTGGTEKGRQLASEDGAERVFDHSEAGYTGKIMEATGGRGVDVILELMANVNLGRDLAMLAKHGRVAVIGSRGKVEIDPRDLMTRDATIAGMSLFNVSPEELASIHAALGAALENKTLRPRIALEFPLRDAAQSHAALSKPGVAGKIILVP